MLGYLKIERSQLLQATYCLARIVDDILDGDLLMAGDPEVYVQCLIQQAKSGVIIGRDFAYRLGLYVFGNINRFAGNGNLPSRHLLDLMNAMLFDRKRSRQRMLLPGPGLPLHPARSGGRSLPRTGEHSRRCGNLGPEPVITPGRLNMGG